MYKVIDYFTNEIVIISDSKEEVRKALKEWTINNPDDCIVIFKDDVMIYP